MLHKLHVDESRQRAIEAMSDGLARGSMLTHAALVVDLFGRVSAVVWLEDGADVEEARQLVTTMLATACAQHWTGTLWVSHHREPARDPDLLCRTAWVEGVPMPTSDRFRVADRYRHHTGWFIAPEQPRIWPLEDGPPIVVFHGFKGGAGRTTLLAGYALARARRGGRVAVVDMDLDAPGVGVLLAADTQGDGGARWGTVDYLLEARDRLPLADYFHRCDPAVVGGPGEVLVFPAGRMDDVYLGKLARVDLDVRRDVSGHPLVALLTAIREQGIDMILVDGRAGLSPAAGLLLSGIAHLHVLLATGSAQSVLGLEQVVRHLGYEQARRELPQRECVVVHALVPDDTAVAKAARDAFAGRVEQIFTDCYYAAAPTEDDRTWSVADLDSDIAPHVPCPVSYRGRLAHFTSIAEVAELLIEDPEHRSLYQRIDERLGLADISEGRLGDG
jgi:cellulose biosynthesis protein BcsQ